MDLTERVFAWLMSAQGPDAIGRLQEIGEAHSRLLSSDVEYFTAPMFQFNSWICRDGVYEHVVRRRRATRQWFTDLVHEGKAEGCMRSDIDTDVAVAEILAWVSWEDLSYLQDRNEAVASAVSAAVFAGIVERIGVRG